MAGKGGGAWKVAYADFVTAMMAFFMVMWLVGQKDSVKEGIAEYFREPPDPFAVFEGNRGTRHSGNKKKSKDHAEAVSPGQLEDNELRRNRGMQIRSSDRSGIGAVVYFDELSDTLSADAKKALEELVPILSGKPQKIEIRGHATRRPLPPDSPFADPWQLCYLRSQAVLHYLEELGLPADRMRLSQASGYEPLTPRIEPEYQAKNPRVEIFLLNEIAEGQPGSENAHGEAAHGAPAHGEEHASESHGAAAMEEGHGDEAAQGDAKKTDDAHAPDTKPKPKPPAAKPAADAGGHGGGGHGGGHGEAKPEPPPAKKGPPPLYTPMRKREPPKPSAPEKKSGGHH